MYQCSLLYKPRDFERIQRQTTIIIKNCITSIYFAVKFVRGLLMLVQYEPTQGQYCNENSLVLWTRADVHSTTTNYSCLLATTTVNHFNLTQYTGWEFLTLHAPFWSKTSLNTLDLESKLGNVWSEFYENVSSSWEENLTQWR